MSWIWLLHAVLLARPEQDTAPLASPIMRERVNRPGRLVFLISLATFVLAMVMGTAQASPPLFDNIGSLHHPISTGSALAQQYFDQGLRLVYAF
ncbi:MAG TPA: hypothetical protein VLE03_12020, partial [Nitrospiraceae bacterium]|nr:hypothetical protein [Nitrospiraceae bacterium]